MTITVVPRVGSPQVIRQVIHLTVCLNEHLKVYLKGVLVPTVIRQGEWKTLTIERGEDKET